MRCHTVSEPRLLISAVGRPTSSIALLAAAISASTASSLARLSCERATRSSFSGLPNSGIFSK